MARSPSPPPPRNVCLIRCNTLQYTVPYCNTLILKFQLFSYASTRHRVMRRAPPPPPRNVYLICCNTLQHTATHCNTLQHAVSHCNTLILRIQNILKIYQTSGDSSSSSSSERLLDLLQDAGFESSLGREFEAGLLLSRCRTLQHTVGHCNTLQHFATHCETLKHSLKQVHLSFSFLLSLSLSLSLNLFFSTPSSRSPSLSCACSLSTRG